MGPAWMLEVRTEMWDLWFSEGLMYFCTIKQLLERAIVCLTIYQERAV